MVKTEKGRLIRERIFYKDDPNRYQRCLDKAKHVEEDVLDNLVKMAQHICKPDNELLKKALEDQGVSAPREDAEEGDIASRVTEEKANEYLQKWKRILVKNEAALDGAANQTTSLLDQTDNEQLEKCKDQLFIETGQDLIDIFASFDYYKLNSQLTDEDRKNYQWKKSYLTWQIIQQPNYAQ